MQSDKCCYQTGSYNNLHEHHIFGGRNRQQSEKYGLKVWLREDWHNGADYGVHFNKGLDTRLKKEGQKAFNEHYDGLDFIKIFGKNYL